MVQNEEQLKRWKHQGEKEERAQEVMCASWGVYCWQDRKEGKDVNLICSPTNLGRVSCEVA